MMDKNYVNDLREFVFENFMLDEEIDQFNNDESLIDLGIVDSYGIVEIATYMEYFWKIKVKDDEINRDNFGSMNKMSDFIARKLNEV